MYISATYFFAASLYRSVWTFFSASFYAGLFITTSASNGARGLPSVYVFSSTYIIDSVPNNDRPLPRWLFRQLSHSPPLLACKRVWGQAWALLWASVLLSVRTSTSASLSASVSTITEASKFSSVLPRALISMCASLPACVHQRLCLHLCHCLVNCVNIHPSYPVSQFADKRLSVSLSDCLAKCVYFHIW